MKGLPFPGIKQTVRDNEVSKFDCMLLYFSGKGDGKWGANLRAKICNETGKFKFIYYT